MTDDRDICERLEDTNYDGAFAMRREAAKLIRQLRHYVDRLEDDLREADLKTESLLKHIGRQQLDISMLTGEAREAQNDHLKAEMEADRLREHIAEQQLDIVVLGQEAGRMRESLLHCANSIAEWERKPEGVAPFLLGALDNARTVLGEEKK